MKPAVLRLLVTAVLFAGWIGYLAYQVFTRPRTSTGQPLVLSHPQILESKIDIVGDINEEREVTVREVLYPSNGVLQEGDKITGANLDESRAPRGPAPPPPDFTGPGTYLLPLKRSADGHYEVVPIPASPGYTPPDRQPAGPPRIYPASKEALAQYRHIRKPE
jgi:hypothetical protein